MDTLESLLFRRVLAVPHIQLLLPTNPFDDIDDFDGMQHGLTNYESLASRCKQTANFMSCCNIYKTIAARQGKTYPGLEILALLLGCDAKEAQEGWASWAGACVVSQLSRINISIE